MSDRFRTFEEFWPFYVQQHSKPLTRWIHFVGTGMALGCLAAFAATRKRRFIPLALLAGYGPAWFSHFFVEQNRPATFTYPLWSLQADFKMFEMMLTGTMDAEVERILAKHNEPSKRADNTDKTESASKDTKPLPN
jgi:hypothetical protein